MAPPTVGFDGAEEVIVIELAAYPTLKVCWTSAAGLKKALPASSKFNVHDPLVTKVTTPEDIVHTLGVAEAIATVSNDVAVAVGV